MNLFEQQQNEFAQRHIGPDAEETTEMLTAIGVESLEELIAKTVPAAILSTQPLQVAGPVSEFQYLTELKKVASLNKVFKTYMGQGYYGTIVPSVILRTVFENPGWYTQYTPYQAEIAQGRLQSLLNFQTMVSDLCALPVANASLLDEGTAAAEAMAMLLNHKNKNTDNKYFCADQRCVNYKSYTNTY
jgi:glycine dehydrogenase